MDSAMTTQELGLRSQAWTFARHFFEMCVAMCAGVGLLTLVTGTALIGSSDLRQQYPGLALLVIAIVITLPMVVWMRFRGMDWGPIIEMSAAGIGVVMVVAGLGIIPASAVQFGSVCGLACVGMLAVMLFRLDLYTGRAGHHIGHGAHKR